jgi:hypothetical protein
VQRVPRRMLKAGTTGVVILGVALFVAACGGASGPGVASIGSTTTTTTAAGTSNLSPFQGPEKEYEYALSYAECMQTHGVPNFPDPTKSSRGFSFNPQADSHSAGYSRANSACKHLLPDDGGPPTAAQTAAETAKLLKYAECMRAHGVPNFPDPIVSSTAFGFRLGNGIDPNSSQFKAANRACQSLGPFGGG